MLAMTHDEIKATHLARVNAYKTDPKFADVRDTEREIDYFRSLVGQRWEIDEEIYLFNREVVPPRNLTSNSFYQGEYLAYDVTLKFTRSQGRYWCEFATYFDPLKNPFR
jgi:hypothetical protein